MFVLKNKKSKEEIQEQRLFEKEKREFKKKFNRLMFELGLYNKFNKTYWLRIVKKTNYGFYAQLYLADGLAFTDLQEKVYKLQQCLNCIWIMKVEQFQDYADVKIVTKPLDKNIPYENPNIKPWQMYLGLGLTLNPIVIDMNKHCMFLLSGATGAGKTTLMYQILLSWILSCKPNEIELYVSDIAKNEYLNFQNVKHVKYYASTLDELANIMDKIQEEFEKTKKIISIAREKGIATNIVEYNKKYKDKLSYRVVFIDELSILIPDKSDNVNDRDKKQKILDILKRFSKMGRNHGIFTFVATQKTTKDEMPSVIKNMSAVRISLRANDAISSEVIMGDNSAVGLADRYAVYSLNGGSDKDYLFSPYLDTKMLNELLKPYIKQIKTDIVSNNTKIRVFPKMPAKEILKLLDENNNSTNKSAKLKGGDFIDY